MENKKILIVKLMLKMSQALNHKQSDVKLKMYVEKLIHYEIEEIKYAFAQVVYELKFFPTLLEIENYINPKETERDKIDKVFTDLVEISNNPIEYKQFMDVFSNAHILSMQKHGKWNDLISGKVDKYYLEKACRSAVKELNLKSKKEKMKEYIENQKRQELE